MIYMAMGIGFAAGKSITANKVSMKGTTVLEKGVNMKISWETQGMTDGGLVQVNLLLNGKGLKQIKSQSISDTDFMWEVDDYGHGTSDQYQLFIFYYQDKTIKSYTNKFTIDAGNSKKTSFDVHEPDDNDTWMEGDKKKIQWDYEGDADNIALYLKSASSSFSRKIDSTRAYKEYHSWYVTSNGNGPGKYYIELYDSNSGLKFKSEEFEIGTESTPEYRLTADSANYSGGYIKINGNTTPNQYSKTHEEGTRIKLEAFANPGYVFKNWSGDISSSDANSKSFSFNLNKAVKAYANFEKEQIEIIKVTPSYTGSGTFDAGERVKITWNTNHTNTSGYVLIRIKRSGNYVEESLSFRNTGSQYVTIPADIDSGTYFFTVEDQSVNGSIGQTNNFVIKEKSMMSVYKVNDAYAIGDRVKIKWSTDYTNPSGKVNVYIYDHRGGTVKESLNMSNTGTIYWDIPETEAGKLVKVRIIDTNESSQQGETNLFKISKTEPLALQSLEDTYTKGDSVELRWNTDYKNASSRMTIDRLDRGGYKDDNITRTSNDGAYSWSIPSNLSVGYYYIKMSDGYNEYRSNRFQIIDNIALRVTPLNAKYNKGDKIKIKWNKNYSNSTGLVEILVLGENGGLLLNTQQRNSGEYLWDTSNERTDLGSLRLKVRDVNARELEDEFSSFRLVDQVILAVQNTNKSVYSNNEDILFKWNTDYTSKSNYVSVQIKDQYNNPMTTARTITNNGQYTWDIPTNVKEGKYYFKVTDGNVSAKSNYFDVKIPLYENVISGLTSQKTVIENQDMTFTWTNSIKDNQLRVDIDLYQNGKAIDDLARNISNTGKYTLKTAGMALGEYRIGVKNIGSNTPSYSVYFKVIEGKKLYIKEFNNKIYNPKDTVVLNWNNDYPSKNYYVRIDLLGPNSSSTPIRTQERNDGYYSFTLSDTLSPGAYTVRVVDANNPKQLAFTPRFTVEDDRVLRVTSISTQKPKQNEKITMKWTTDYSGRSSYVKAELVGSNYRETLNNRERNDGSGTFTLPINLKTGKYKIVLSDSGGKGYTASSEDITIKKTIMAFISSVKESYRPGDEFSITWEDEYQNAYRYVKVDLYKDGAYSSTIAKSIKNDGNESIKLSEDVKSGTYKIRITDRNSPELFAESAAFKVEAFDSGDVILRITGLREGNHYNFGSKVEIGWTLNDAYKNSKEPIKLLLFENGDEKRTIGTAILKDKGFKWESKIYQSDYIWHQVKIVTADGKKVLAESANFKMFNPSIEKVDFMLDNSQISYGDEFELNWTTHGSRIWKYRTISDKVDLQFFFGNDNFKTIENVSSKTYSSSKTIKAVVPDQYLNKYIVIRVVDSENPNIYKDSDMFKINASTMVVKLNKKSVQPESDIKVSWNGGTKERYNVMLLQNDIEIDKKNNIKGSQYTFEVPAGIDPDDDLVVKVVDRSKTEVVGYSDIFHTTSVGFTKADNQKVSKVIKDKVLREKIIQQTGKKDPIVADLKTITSFTANGSYMNKKIKSLKGIEHLVNLKTLTITHNSIDEDDLEYISKLKKLGVLHLSDNKISKLDVGPKNNYYLGQLPNLMTLYLNQNGIGDLKGLENCDQLTILHVNNCEIQDMSTANQMSRLQTLSIMSNELEDISVLASMNSLKYLEMSGNEDVTNAQYFDDWEKASDHFGKGPIVKKAVDMETKRSEYDKAMDFAEEEVQSTRDSFFFLPRN